MKSTHSTRRTFIRNSSLITAGTMFLSKTGYGMQFGGGIAANRSIPEPDTIGHGNFRYKLRKDWGTQDIRQYPVMDCHEMVQDSTGRLFLLTNHPRNNVIIYDRSGKVLDTWTLNLKGAHGLTISNEFEEEVLYITSTTEHTVYKTDLNGRVLLEIPYPRETGQYASAEKYLPTETTIGPNGDIYIADGYGENYIMQYTQKGELVRFWGGKGDSESQFDCCHGITLDTRDNGDPSLLITSRSKQEFKRFALDGTHLETVPLPGCWICRPVIKGDYLYFAVIVTKTWGAYDGCLIILDKENKVVSCPGGSTPEYANGALQPPQYDDASFLNPHDVCIDRDDNLYVPQWASGRTYPVMLERLG